MREAEGGIVEAAVLVCGGEDSQKYGDFRES